MSEDQLNEACPRCGAKGKKTKAITIESQVTDEAKESLDGFDGFRFCGTADCPVAYYRPADGSVVDKYLARFPIFQKEESPERLVCYCFQNSVQKIRDEVKATGDTKVIQEIKDSCKRGMDDCARNNPQGSCCLGNVSKVVKEAKGLAMAAVEGGCCSEEKVSDVAANESGSCCSAGECSTDAPTSKSGTNAAGSQAPKLALSGALLAAMASSACCWLPLLLIGTGLSAAGVAGFFEAYRLFFVVGSVALLGVGFYFVYFRKPVCEDGTACSVPSSGMRRFTRSMLWVATAMIAAFTLFPNALSVWAKSREEPNEVAIASIEKSQLLNFAVEGMTCEACAIGLKGELAKLPGLESVEVSYEKGRVMTTVSDPSDAKRNRILDTIKSAGYSGRLIEETHMAFSIEGMTCSACAVSAERKIEALPGIVSAKVDYRSKSANVVTEDHVAPDAVSTAVAELGYTAKRKEQ